MSSNIEFNQSKFDIFCKRYNLKFPQVFIDFLSKYNDGELNSNIVDGFDECSVRYFYGTTSEEYSDIESTFKCFTGRMPLNCIPIAEAEGGNLVCMSLDSAETFGKIYYWDHETMDVDDGEACKYSITSMPQLAASFKEFLDKIIEC